MSNNLSERANAIIALIGEPTILYHPALAVALHRRNQYAGLKDALFISALDSLEADGDGWVQATVEELHNLTGLSRTQQASVRKRLQALGLLEEKLAGIPALKYYRLDIDVLKEIVDGEGASEH